MATRTNMRPRPVDVNKPLAIVRSIEDIDNWELIDFGLNPDLPGINPQAGPAAGSYTPAGPASVTPYTQMGLGGKGGAASMGAAAALTLPLSAAPKKKKAKEIPVLEVNTVPSYTRDYLPTFPVPETYLRASKAQEPQPVDYVEYDLEGDDEDWLQERCRGAPGWLSDMKFEEMLWRLEVAWGERMDQMLSATDRMSPANLVSTACLTKPTALHILRKTVGGHDRLLDEVYEYWAAKRKRTGKPLLRRLQAPTNPNDQNPYNTFRPREKANRPLTRRRRENSTECLEKLRQVRDNLVRALQLAELVGLRERKKLHVAAADMLLQRLQQGMAHLPPGPLPDLLMAEAGARLQELCTQSGRLDVRIQTYVDAEGTQQLGTLDMTTRQALGRKRRRRDADLLSLLVATNNEVLASLPPPVPPSEPEALFSYQPNLLELCATGQEEEEGVAGRPTRSLGLSRDLVAGLVTGTLQPYVGRCGRLVLARADPLTLKPFPAAEPLRGLAGAVGGAPWGPMAPGMGVLGLQGGAQGALQGAPGLTPALLSQPGAVSAGGPLQGVNGLGPGGPSLQAEIARLSAVAAGQQGSAGGLSVAADGPPAGAPPAPASGGGALQGPSGAVPLLGAELSDAELLSCNPPLGDCEQPWAAVLDLSLLPDHIPRGPLLAARQRFAAMQALRDSGVAWPGAGAAVLAGQAAAGTQPQEVAARTGAIPQGLPGLRSRLARLSAHALWVTVDEGAEVAAKELHKQDQEARGVSVQVAAAAGVLLGAGVVPAGMAAGGAGLAALTAMQGVQGLQMALPPMVMPIGMNMAGAMDWMNNKGGMLQPAPGALMGVPGVQLAGLRQPGLTPQQAQQVQHQTPGSQPLKRGPGRPPKSAGAG